jgi:hypothetical protein
VRATQDFVTTEEVEEAEFNIAEVGCVMAHGVIVLPASNLCKSGGELFFEPQSIGSPRATK